MQINRRTFVLALVALAGYAGWTAIRPGGKEIAVLRVFDGRGKDYFANLWVVDDESGFVWIQAERPDERWLPVVAANPKVELRRRGHSASYVAPKFRAKYGIADRLREWRNGRDTIPVRLQAR